MGGGGKVNAWMHVGGATLSACAGAINIIAFYQWGSMVSSTTGNWSKAAGRLEGQMDGDWVDKLMVVVSFTAGSFVCGLIIAHNNVHFGMALYDLGLIGTSLLLVLSMVIHEEKGAKHLVALACGLQNGMTTQYNGAVIRTTHVTGTMTDAALMSGRLISRFCRRSCKCSNYDAVDKAEMDVELRKVFLLSLLASSFFVGILLGAVLFKEMEETAMAIPAAILGAAGLAYMFYRVKILHHKFYDTSEQELCEVPVSSMSPEELHESREEIALHIAGASHDAHLENSTFEEELRKEHEAGLKRMMRASAKDLVVEDVSAEKTNLPSLAALAEADSKAFVPAKADEIVRPAATDNPASTGTLPGQMDN